MSVYFRELGGSPVEEYDLAGFHAKREFLINWQDREAFAAEVLGVASTYGARTWVHYPGKASVFAVRLRYEPFDPDNPDPKEIPSLTDGLNSYTLSFAKATVEYETVNDVDRTDGPTNETGTHLTYQMRFAADEQPLPSRGWTWEDRPSLVVPDDLGLIRRIPVTEHHLTWHQVVNPPWEVIARLQGTVNAGLFLGCPAETLLFEGAEANKLYRAGLESEPSAFCWQIHYLFRQRAIKHGGGVYGWNHAYRDSPAGWARLTNGTATLYDLSDFAPLFQSVSTP